MEDQDIPMILKVRNQKYILDKIYNNFALYTEMSCGYKECFNLFEIQMLKNNIERPRSYTKLLKKYVYNK